MKKKTNNKNAPKKCTKKTVKVNKVFMLCHIGQVGPGGSEKDLGNNI
jgi:hypothetical protein